MSDFRYERKFVTRELTRRQVEMLVSRHPACFSILYPPRWINNIYFDSPDMRAVKETVDGVSRREKLRIRWYGEFEQEIERPVLERKSKSGLLGDKSSWPLGPLKIGPSLTAHDVKDRLAEAGLPERLALHLAALEPVLFNRYKRCYFGSADRLMRLTIDESLQYHAFRRMGGHYLQWAHQRRFLVVELKYACEHNERAAEVVQDFPLRVSRNSKYVTGMSMVYPRVEL